MCIHCFVVIRARSSAFTITSKVNRNPHNVSLLIPGGNLRPRGRDACAVGGAQESAAYIVEGMGKGFRSKVYAPEIWHEQRQTNH